MSFIVNKITDTFSVKCPWFFMATWHLPFCTTVKIIVRGQVCMTEKSFHKFLSKFDVVCPRKKAILVLEIILNLGIYFTTSKVSSSAGRQSSQEQTGLAINGATQSLLCFLFICGWGFFHAAKFK